MKTYNREKTIAIGTGIVCGLVFFGGTALGGFHAIATIGGFGVLALACYLIADVAIVWASYIDYHEDGGPVEWTAWIVKYGLSAFLLFSGGCIAYHLFDEGAMNKAQSSRVEATQKAFNDCRKSGGGPKDCRALASTIQTAEAKSAKEEKSEKDKTAGFVKDYLEWPLMKYLPGLLGLLGLFSLTLVSKLSPQEQGGQVIANGPMQPLPLPVMSGGRIGQTATAAPFTSPPRQSFASVSNNKRGSLNAAFRFKAQGNGYQISFRHNGAEKSVGLVSAPEASVYSTMDYESLAKEMIALRRSKNTRSDQTAKEIEATL